MTSKATSVATNSQRRCEVCNTVDDQSRRVGGASGQNSSPSSSKLAPVPGEAFCRGWNSIECWTRPGSSCPLTSDLRAGRCSPSLCGLQASVGLTLLHSKGDLRRWLLPHPSAHPAASSIQIFSANPQRADSCQTRVLMAIAQRAAEPLMNGANKPQKAAAFQGNAPQSFNGQNHPLILTFSIGVRVLH